MHLNESSNGPTDLRQALSSNGCGDSIQRHRGYYFVRAAPERYFRRSRMRGKLGNAGRRRTLRSSTLGGGMPSVSLSRLPSVIDPG
jgi:hypothetical protein